MNPGEVSDQLEVRTPEAEQPNLGVVAELAGFPPAAEFSGPAQDSANSPGIPLAWLRLGYALEFLIALLAIVTMWSEIGGEGHLDLMPWYVKLSCILGLAWCSVRLTASVVEQRRVWTGRTIGWLTGILIFCLLMGGITYYYHLHEPSDDDSDDSDTTAAVKINYPGNFLHHGDQRTCLSPSIHGVACSSNAGRDRISTRGHRRDPRLRL